jgi:hypothetical protein
MREISQIDQIAFADLAQKCLDAEFDSAYPPNGSFFLQRRGDRKYWYYRGYDRLGLAGEGRQSFKYAGPDSDPEIRRRVEEFGRAKAGYRVRRELASKLRAAGLPSPTRLEGDVLSALALAGIFRLRAVLVGSIAYQTYAGVLGVRLPAALMRTGDIDVAQFFGISQQIDDSVDDLQSALQAVDPSFRPLFHAQSRNLAAGFISKSGFKVEFLTPNRGDRTYEAALAPMPALGPGMGAQVLRFLDFAIKDPIRTVVLHDAGVPVTVPAPERYAIHKLIVSTLRSQEGHQKAAKDLDQAANLIEAMAKARREIDLGLVWFEAVDRGASWRRRLLRSCLRLSEEHFAMLQAAATAAARIEGRDLEEGGLTEGKDGVLKRLAGHSLKNDTSEPKVG